MEDMTRMSPVKHIVIDARVRSSGVGAGRYVDRLLEHLQTLDSVNQYTLLLDPKDSWRPDAKNFKTVACPYKRFSFNPLDQLTFGRFIAKLKPDLVHFTMTPMEPMLYFGKRITTAHDLTMFNYVRAGGLHPMLHAVRMVGYRLTFWWGLRLAKRIIVPTQFVADDVGRKYHFAKKRVVVTYESSEPPLEDKAVHPQGVSVPFIMHVGSPLPHKNLEGLIEAFALLKQSHPKLQLVLVGKKEKYFQALEAAAKDHPFSKDIIFPGFVPDAGLKWLYQNAEAYVLPSFSEGFGLTGLEAIVHGCPLVSSNATCLPEVFGDAAEYFDPRDIQDMADKVSSVISDNKHRKKLIANGYIRLKKFSWQRMADQTLDIYKGLL
jgi:glycosyltransferase involved in cell wall biosynthesis